MAVTDYATSGTDYNKVASLYDQAFADIRVRRVEWAWLGSWLRPENWDSPPRVLEIGCGTGALLRALRPYISQGVGVDVSPGMVEKAKARSQDDPGLEYQVIAKELPFAAASFDLVISFLSYRYLDWQTIPAEIRRVLRPNGRFLCVDMVAQPTKIFEFPRLVTDIACARFTTPAEFRKNLRALVSHPDWQAMRRNNPMRSHADWREHAQAVWGVDCRTLSLGRRSRISAFAALPELGTDPAPNCPDVAVLDWGIGGTAIYRDLANRLPPGRRVMYYSDAGTVPYGRQSLPSLRRRLGQLCRRLSSLGCRHLVVACNAMSAAIPETGKTLHAVGVIGMVGPGLRGLEVLAQGQNLRTIGLIGGEATIRRGQWERGLRKMGFRVRTASAQALSAEIEAGRQDSPEFRRLVQGLAENLGQIDLLVLACTHYPAARAVFESVFEGIPLYDPAASVVETAMAALSPFTGLGTRSEGAVWLRACTTGDPVASGRSSHLAFGVDLRFQHLDDW